MQKIDVKELSSALVEAYEAYTDDVIEEINVAADEISKNALAQVKEDAPKRRPEYYKGFKRVHRRLKNGKEYAIWNPKYYSLVHLVEKGHVKRTGERVPGKPHMEPTEVKMVAEFEKRVEKAIKEGGK